MTTDVITTEQPVLTGGISSVAFFNGRLLTGEDLTREQLATTEARLRVGRVLGSGVACGFGVSLRSSADLTRPVLAITAGRAVNLRGAVLELAGAVDLALTREPTTGGAAEAVFTDCTPLQPGTYLAGAGAYVLTVAPARRGVGRAPVSGLQNAQAQCNVAYSVEGVQFQLLRVALPALVLTDPKKIRNRVAHLMVGTGSIERVAAMADPLSPGPARYGMLDELAAQGCITDDQVPLAFLLWTGEDGVVYVDAWCVRRRLRPPTTDRFAALTGDRARVDAMAVFDQFQNHVADLLGGASTTPGLAQERAADRFDLLPPVAMVPIVGDDGRGAGYDPDLFLEGQGSSELATLDADDLRALVQEGFDHTPVQVGSATRIQRYLLWENELARSLGFTPQRVMVIAREGVGYRGVARYGKARSSSSRYSRSVT
jgi:hypothetical protein